MEKYLSRFVVFWSNCSSKAWMHALSIQFEITHGELTAIDMAFGTVLSNVKGYISKQEHKPKKSPKVVSIIIRWLRREPITPKITSTLSIKISTATTKWISKKLYVEAESELLPYLTQ